MLIATQYGGSMPKQSHHTHLHAHTPGPSHQGRALTGRFLQRKLVEYQALQAEIAALRAEAYTQQTLEQEEGEAPLSITS